MKPIELKEKLSEHMKQVKREYSNQGIKIFFAYGLDGYLGVYEYGINDFWRNGKFIKFYINNGD